MSILHYPHSHPHHCGSPHPLHSPHSQGFHHIRGILPPFVITTAILKLISKKPMHGYQIAEKLSEMLGQQIQKPLVYMALRRLEVAGLVTFKWETGEKGPARKLYYITEEGQVVLEKRLEVLKKIKDFLERIIEE